MATAASAGLRVKHYSIEAWADYVRGLGPEADRREMARHLSGGCSRCQRRVALLADVSDAVRTTAPEDAVQAAIDLFETGRDPSRRTRRSRG